MLLSEIGNTILGNLKNDWRPYLVKRKVFRYQSLWISHQFWKRWMLFIWNLKRPDLIRLFKRDTSVYWDERKAFYLWILHHPNHHQQQSLLFSNPQIVSQQKWKYFYRSFKASWCNSFNRTHSVSRARNWLKCLRISENQ